MSGRRKYKNRSVSAGEEVTIVENDRKKRQKDETTIRRRRLLNGSLSEDDRIGQIQLRREVTARKSVQITQILFWACRHNGKICRGRE